MGRHKDKWIKKTVNYYRYIFKFDSPFKVILDGNILAVSLKKKFDLKSKLESLLDDKINLIITSCVFKEIQEIDKNIPGLLSLVSTYKIEKCSHNLLNPINCIQTYIGKKNKNKYFVATQDKFLRAQLRKIPGVPLIFFDQNMLLIEKLSRISIEASERRESLKEDPQKKEKIELKEKKNEIKEFLIEEYKNSKYYKQKQEEFKINKLMGRVKKKALGPNPLSVKKKKSYYINKEKDRIYKQKLKEENNNNNEFIKRKRHRKNKNKNNFINNNNNIE